MASVSGINPSPQIEQALRRASAATGTDFDYLLRTAQRESALKPEAKSSTSTATGLFQFIEQTWLATVKAAGPRFGLQAQADAITRSSNGRYNVADPDARAEILALRRDPETAALMAGVYTREAGEALETALGRAPRTGELYMAHFLGTGGAIRMIEAAQTTPDARADKLFPQAADANRRIFYERDGAPRSIADVYRNLVAQHGTEVAQFGTGGSGGSAMPSGAPPVPAGLTLASHFQLAAPQGPGAFASPASATAFVIEPASAPLREVARGPLNIIPEGVRDETSGDAAHGKLGAVRMGLAPAGELESDPSQGLLQRFAPLYALFRTS